MDVLKTGSFMQRVTERIPVDEKINSVAIGNDGSIYVCTDSGLLKFINGEEKVLFGDGAFGRVHCDKNGRVFASQGKKLFIITDNGAESFGVFDYDITDLQGENELYVLTEHTLDVERDDGFYRLQDISQKSISLAVSGEKVCVISRKCVQRMEGKRRTWRIIFPAHSTMPEININVIAFDKQGYLLVGADEGLYIYDYKSGWYNHKQISALPEEKIYSISIGKDGAYLLGTDAGAVIIKNGMSKYLTATRYAYDTDVTAVAYNDGTCYTASNGGVVITSEKEMTLFEKSKYMFEQTEKYFPRKDGFITSVNALDGKHCSNVSDNDGLWTHSYLAGLCLWYAVTKDEEILKAARRTKDAMLVLTRAPEIKGFTARAVRYPDEEHWGVGLDTQEIGA